MTYPIPVLDEVDRATAGLLETCRRLSDADLAADSLLPGWSRGHVLTHVARNADSLVNLLTWARTGVQTPQYPSQQVRDSDIEAGAARPVTRQIADLEASAVRFRSAAATLPAGAWDAAVRTRGGRRIVARDLPWSRLREVAIHHVDLAARYTSADWPAEFVARLLPELVDDFARRTDAPAVRLHAPDLDAAIGDGEPTVTVSGDGHALVAWLIGRSDGSALTATPGGPLPALPTWR